MMNKEYIKIVLIVLQITLALLYDIHEYKIRNYIPFTFILLGIIYHLVFEDAANFYGGLLGLSIPFILLFPLYSLKMLGAGDIKLLCSIGVLLGPSDILTSIFYSFFFGGILALLIMACRKNLISRLRKLLFYFRSCVLTMSITPYEEVDGSHPARMHFSIPIALGVLAVHYIKLRGGMA